MSASVTKLLNCKIIANTEGLGKGLLSASAMLDRFVTSVELGKGISLSAFGAYGLAITSVISAVKKLGAALVGIGQYADEIDNIGKAAERTGSSLAGFQGVKLAAGLEGIEDDALNTAFAKLNQSIFDASEGSEAALAPFERLGISLSSLEGMTTDQVFALVASRIDALPSSFAKTSTAMDIFGKSGVKMLDTFKKLGELGGLENASEAAKKMGLAVSAWDVEQAAGFNDAVDDLSLTWTGIKQSLATAVLPVATAVLQSFQEMGSALNWTSIITHTFQGMAREAAIVLDIFDAISFVAVAAAVPLISGIENALDVATAIVDTLRSMPGFGMLPDVSKLRDGIKGVKAEAAQSMRDYLSGPSNLDRTNTRLADMRVKRNEPNSSPENELTIKTKPVKPQNLIQELGIKIDKRPAEEFKSTLVNLGKALRGGAVSVTQYKQGVEDAQKTFLKGLNIEIKQQPIIEFKKNLTDLTSATVQGGFTMRTYREAVTELKNNLLQEAGVKLDASPLQDYQKGLTILNQGLRSTAFTTDEVATHAKQLKQTFLDTLGVKLDSTSISNFSDKVNQLQQAFNNGQVGLSEYKQGVEQLKLQAQQEIGITIKSSPLQEFGEKLKKMQSLMDAGLMSFPEYSQALGQSVEEMGFLNPPEIKAPELAQVGSQEAFRAMDKFQNQQGGSSPMDRIVAGIDRQREVEERQARKLDEIARNLKFEVVDL